MLGRNEIGRQRHARCTHDLINLPNRNVRIAVDQAQSGDGFKDALMARKRCGLWGDLGNAPRWRVGRH